MSADFALQVMVTVNARLERHEIQKTFKYEMLEGYVVKFALYAILFKKYQNY